MSRLHDAVKLHESLVRHARMRASAESPLLIDVPSSRFSLWPDGAPRYRRVLCGRESGGRLIAATITHVVSVDGDTARVVACSDLELRRHGTKQDMIGGRGGVSLRSGDDAVWLGDGSGFFAVWYVLMSLRDNAERGHGRENLDALLE